VTEDLGTKPAPDIEPSEPNPGGVDAIEGNDHDVAPVVPDLSPEDNPAVDEAPEELNQPEDTDQGASSDGASEPEKETQA
jgi:hypothetical protein